MRSPLKLALAAVVLAGLGIFAWYQQRRASEAEATQAALAEASAAMKQLNAEDERFPLSFQQAMSGATHALLLGPERGAEAIGKLLPLVDAYLATIDRATQRADAYLARAPDPTLAQQIDQIRARGAGFRSLRNEVAAIQARAAKGESLDELAKALTAAGTSLMMSGLTK